MVFKIPQQGDTKSKKSFCWFPIKGEHNWYWLERVTLTYQYQAKKGKQPPIRPSRFKWVLIAIDFTPKEFV
jgi:hypothetical protein